MFGSTLILIVILAVLAFGTLIFVASRYRRCPSDRRPGSSRAGEGSIL